jgi:ABC-type sugar transport system ATPase subunit
MRDSFSTAESSMWSRLGGEMWQWSFKAMPYIRMMNVDKNLAFGPRVRPEAMETHMYVFSMSPNGSGVAISEKKAIAGGQRQRVDLGGALLRDPTLFLMDEPDGGREACPKELRP